MDIVVAALPPRPQLLLRLIAAVLSLVVVLVVLWTANEMWWEATKNGWTSSTVRAAPLSIVYAVLPLGMLLTACQYVAFLIEGVLGLLGRHPEEGIALLKQQEPELSANETFDVVSAESGTRPGSGPTPTERSM